MNNPICSRCDMTCGLSTTERDKLYYNWYPTKEYLTTGRVFCKGLLVENCNKEPRKDTE